MEIEVGDNVVFGKSNTKGEVASIVDGQATIVYFGVDGSLDTIKLSVEDIKLQEDDDDE